MSQLSRTEAAEITINVSIQQPIRSSVRLHILVKVCNLASVLKLMLLRYIL